MNKRILLFSAVFTFLLLGCQSGTDTEIRRCDQMTIENFDRFLSISKNTPEVELKDKLGKSTGGEYTADKKTFIYEFKGTLRVPVFVYVNAESGKIETVFMEILGLKNNFEIDVKKADSDYPIEYCHLDLFGKQPKELLAIFGKPVNDTMKEDNVEADVRTIFYESRDGKIRVTFNFYPSQDYKLSAIKVNWF